MIWKKGFAIVLIVLLIFLLFPTPTEASNLGLTLIQITGGTLIAVEFGHLIYWLVKKIKLKKTKQKKPPPPIHTNEIFVSHTTNVDLGEYNDLFVNLGEETNVKVTTHSNTNIMTTNTNVRVLAMTNIITNYIQKNTNVIETNQLISQATNMITYDTNLFVSHEKITNLTEQEKQDIELFGKDYYYLVSLAYYRVKKYTKSKEFMFHSIAIGEKIEEGIRFLKKNFHLSEKQIHQGVKKYFSSRK